MSSILIGLLTFKLWLVLTTLLVRFVEYVRSIELWTEGDQL